MATKIPQTPADYDRTRITERPDGVYWQSVDGDREYGPFATLMAAVQDMEFADTDVEEPIDDAEDAIGIAGWVDPDTGEPAEEFIPRLEDH